MSLADRVRPVDPVLASRVRGSHPKGWEPGVRFDPDGAPVEVVSPLVPKIVGEDYSSILESMQVELPDGFELRLVNASYDPFAWTRGTAFTDGVKTPATTVAAWRYRFAVVKSEKRIELDALALLGRLKRTPKPRTRFTGDSAFVTLLSDWQYGKVANGLGTPELLERLDRMFDGVVERAKDLGKRHLGELVVPVMGDLVEGCFIYPNQAHQIDRDRRQQTNGATEVLLDYLDRVSGFFKRVRVVAVPGNHGEHRVDGHRINRHDNDDVKVVEDVARAVSRDPRMQHVSFMVAQEQMALTVDVLGHIVAVTHGHVFAKDKGATPDVKAYEWYKNMAAGHNPVGDASVLLTAHWHHDIVKNFGSLLLVQNPAADNGSPEFSDYSGTDCPAGLTTFVVSPDRKFRDYEVIR